VLLTDGIAEAYDDQRVLFGLARVESISTEAPTVGDVAEEPRSIMARTTTSPLLGVARL